MPNIKTILFCPLNWGLGHASRIIPLVKYFADKKYNVIVAADGKALSLIKLELPDIKNIRLKGYHVVYSRKKTLILKILQNLPSILYWTIHEHQILKRICKTHNVDLIISDNRYGLWHKDIPSIMITHQLSLKMPKGFRVIERCSKYLISSIVKNFNQCWIPDLPGENNLTGSLSHLKYSLKNSFFIGVLSRFQVRKAEPLPANIEMPDVLVLLSGPEPQRSILENILLEQLKHSSYKVLILRGLPGASKEVSKIENLTKSIQTASHLPTNITRGLLEKVQHIICRAGYTSIMDLIYLKRKAILIPTPGQTEQEHLAMHLKKYACFHFVKQAKFNLDNALQEIKNLHHPNFPDSEFNQTVYALISGLLRKS